MLSIFFYFTSAIWILICVICIALLLRSNFRGRLALLVFLSITLLISITSHGIRPLIESGVLSEESLRYFFTTIRPIINTALLLLLLVFVLQIRPNGSTNNAATRHYLMPPNWLVLITGVVTAFCIFQNIDDSILRSLAKSMTQPYPGGGGAIGRANQLSMLNTLANLFGTLYIATGALCLTCMGYVVFKFFKKDGRNAPNVGST